VEDGSVGAIFPGVTNTPFSFDILAGYQIETVMEPGYGYWLKFPFAISEEMIHTSPFTVPRLTDTLAVMSGWNLVGSLSDSVPVGSIGSVPPGILTGQFFGYNRGYYVANVLEPRRGYWVKVSSAGDLVISAAGMELQSRIVIRPDGELPPLPPGENTSSAAEIPSEIKLSQNYPNPFNPVTRIQYEIPAATSVSLRIFNVLGQTVESLLDEVKPAGVYQAEWHASKYPSGVYFYRLQAGSFVETKKLVLMR
jgi:hypothetical protein